MEKLDEKPGLELTLVSIPESAKHQIEAEKIINRNVMSIRLTTDGIVIKDELSLRNEDSAEKLKGKLSGVYYDGVQYFDLKGVHYINNTGMAILIDLLKSLLEMGVEVQFVNVHNKIKKKIREMGLENVIHYTPNKT